MYRKQTPTNLLLNCNAIFPINWKSGPVLCLLNGAKIICSITRCFNRRFKNVGQCFKKMDNQAHFLVKYLKKKVVYKLTCFSATFDLQICFRSRDKKE